MQGRAGSPLPDGLGAEQGNEHLLTFEARRGLRALPRRSVCLVSVHGEDRCAQPKHPVSLNRGAYFTFVAGAGLTCR